MSIPPQLIRVKRKRVDEVPVTFLQFDEGHKRHRSSNNWAYRRRDPASQPAPSPAVPSKPVIHVGQPEDASSPARRRRVDSPPSSSAAARPSAPASRADGAEPRRFHISRSTLSASKGPAHRAGISKHGRALSTIFVEQNLKKKKPRLRKDASALQMAIGADDGATSPPRHVSPKPVLTQDLKRPGIANKARGEAAADRPTHAPLPASLMNRQTDDDMDKIAADMDQWVLNEIGANLHSMEEEEKRKSQKLRFRPKVPAQRYRDRHPEAAPANQTQDVAMDDASEDGSDDDDWIIDEYVRIPAHSVAVDVSPSDIGVLVLDDEDENLLYFGSLDDDEDDDEDEEDENAENHYTADYPEDEVDSDDEVGTDDEYGRPYGYCNGTASSGAEFDRFYCSDDNNGDDAMSLGNDQGGDDDDGEDKRIARMHAYMKRNSAFP